MWRFALAIAVVVSWPLAPCAQASDHNDPLSLDDVEAGLTGLFVFPKDQDLIFILGLNRGLRTAPPLDLEDYTYTFHIDLDSPLSFDSEEDRARYGGTVVKPEGLSADVTMAFELKDDASIHSKTLRGLKSTDKVKVWSGVRDDPFILPNFFGTNVVAIVVSVPLAAFPDGQQHWIVWATSHDGDDQIDHVGRANRTMLPRLDILNTVHPSEHIAALTAQDENPGLSADIMRTEITPLFKPRPYDLFPDVMIYTRQFDAGFPNGRRLTDDVAALTCQQGDCLLWENSYTTSAQWPRATENDKPFPDAFPFLADPWPDSEAPDEPSLTTRNKILLIVFVLVFLGLVLVPAVLFWWPRVRGWIARIKRRKVT